VGSTRIEVCRPRNAPSKDLSRLAVELAHAWALAVAKASLGDRDAGWL
jgi:hypothetical protein